MTKYVVSTTKTVESQKDRIRELEEKLTRMQAELSIKPTLEGHLKNDSKHIKVLEKTLEKKQEQLDMVLKNGHKAKVFIPGKTRVQARQNGKGGCFRKYSKNDKGTVVEITKVKVRWGDIDSDRVGTVSETRALKLDILDILPPIEDNDTV